MGDRKVGVNRVEMDEAKRIIRSKKMVLDDFEMAIVKNI